MYARVHFCGPRIDVIHDPRRSAQIIPCTPLPPLPPPSVPSLPRSLRPACAPFPTSDPPRPGELAPILKRANLRARHRANTSLDCWQALFARGIRHCLVGPARGARAHVGGRRAAGHASMNLCCCPASLPGLLPLRRHDVATGSAALTVWCSFHLGVNSALWIDAGARPQSPPASGERKRVRG